MDNLSLEVLSQRSLGAPQSRGDSLDFVVKGALQVRHSLEIRDAGPEDAAALLELWATAAGRATEQVGVRSESEAVAALAQLAGDPDERMVVGLVEGVIIAAVHLRRVPISPLHTDMAVHTSYLLVSPEHRKHGVAHALLEAAVTWAEEKDVAHVTAAVTTGARDTNRFLARLGLAPVATIRVASTPLLRRKLSPPALRTGESRRSLGVVLAQRRSIQRRSGSLGLPGSSGSSGFSGSLEGDR